MLYLNGETYNLKLKNEDLFETICNDKNKEYTSGENNIMETIMNYCIYNIIDFTYNKKDTFEDYVSEDFITIELQCFVPFKNIEENNDLSNFSEIENGFAEKIINFIETKKIKEISMNFKPQIYTVVPNITVNAMNVVFVCQFSYKKGE